MIRFSAYFYFAAFNLLGVAIGYFPRDCDKGNVKMEEGILTESSFPWMGILKVYLHEIDEERVAVSHLVLIKEAFAIAHANDIVKIPKKILLKDSKVLFKSEDDYSWYSHVKDYVVHPDFKKTFNTILVMELHEFWSQETGQYSKFLGKPICWPFLNYNTSTDLYVIGYTDANSILEKEINKLQYINKPMCDEFYKINNLSEVTQAPVDYQCAFAKNLQQNCIWENGMVVASNASGIWVLIGFTVRGPGCAAPVRFMNMMSYLSWVESLTAWNSSNKHENGRRNTAFGDGFKLKPQIANTGDIKGPGLLFEDLKLPMVTNTIVIDCLHYVPEKIDNLPIHSLFHELPALREQMHNADDYFKEDPNQKPEYAPYFHDKYAPYYANVFTGMPSSKWSLVMSPKINTTAKTADFELLEDDCKKELKFLAYKESTIVGESSDALFNGVYYMESRDFGPGMAWLDFFVELSPDKYLQPPETLKRVPISPKKVQPKAAKENDESSTEPTYISSTNDYNETTTEPYSLPKSFELQTVSYLTERPHRKFDQTVNLAIKFQLIGRAVLKAEVYGIRKSFVELPLNKTKGQVFFPRRSTVNNQKPTGMGGVESLFWSGEDIDAIRRKMDEENLGHSKRNSMFVPKKVKRKKVKKTNYKTAKKYVGNEDDDNILIWRTADSYLGNSVNNNSIVSESQNTAHVTAKGCRISYSKRTPFMLLTFLMLL